MTLLFNLWHAIIWSTAAGSYFSHKSTQTPPAIQWLFVTATETESLFFCNEISRWKSPLNFWDRLEISKWKKTFKTKISRACQIARKKSARVFLFYEKLKDRERERERESESEWDTGSAYACDWIRTQVDRGGQGLNERSDLRFSSSLSLFFFFFFSGEIDIEGGTQLQSLTCYRNWSSNLATGSEGSIERVRPVL